MLLHRRSNETKFNYHMKESYENELQNYLIVYKKKVVEIRTHLYIV